MTPGDIVWLTLPAGHGRAQFGSRPGVPLQDEAVSRRVPTVLVAPLTTRLHARHYPGTVSVSPPPLNGLPAASVVLVFQLAAIDVTDVGEQIGSLSPSDLAAVWTALDVVTGRSRAEAVPQKAPTEWHAE